MLYFCTIKVNENARCVSLSYFSKPQLSCVRPFSTRPSARESYGSGRWATSRAIHTDPQGCLLQGLGPAAKTLLLGPPRAASLPRTSMGATLQTPSQDNSDLDCGQ